MKTVRFPWLDTLHQVAAFERSSLDVRPTPSGGFTNNRGDVLLPPPIFPLGPGGPTPEEYLASLPFSEGSLQSGLHFFLLMQAGAFAAALWENGVCRNQKVLKRYVVRARSGRAQSAHNSRRKARSEGARLRTRNESALLLDLDAILAQWRSGIEACSTLFYSAPVRLRGQLLTNGAGTLPGPRDPRWCKIPLDLGRPGMAELQRATFEMTHGSLTTVTESGL